MVAIQIRCYIIVFIIGMVSIVHGQKQAPGRDLAERLLPNVVALHTKYKNNEENGYGLIVGKHKDSIYVLTAAHVILDPFGGGRSNIEVSFTNSNIIENAELLDLMPNADVAVLRVLDQKIPKWKKKWIDPYPKLGESARFIGRNGLIQVCLRKEEGAVSDVAQLLVLKADSLRIQRGNSGGPLLNDQGIIGILSEQDDTEGTATKIGPIANWFKDKHYGKAFQLKEFPRTGNYNLELGVLTVGLGLGLWGIIKEQRAQDDIKIYNTVRNPLDLVYETNNLTREEWYENANNDHILGQALMVTGGAMVGIGTYLFFRQAKINKKNRSNLGVSIAPALSRDTDWLALLSYRF